jgi:hypothetical protein
MTNNSKIPDPSDKNFISEQFTRAALEEELFLNLYSVRISIQNSGREIIVRKYEELARYLMYKIPVSNPISEYIININDISRNIRNQLDDLDDITLYDVLKEVIGRFFLNLNERYFLLSVKRLLRWRLEP